MHHNTMQYSTKGVWPVAHCLVSVLALKGKKFTPDLFDFTAEGGQEK